jgi:Fe-S cluster assembly protein SufD
MEKITKLIQSTLMVSKPAIILDWQKRFKKTTVTVNAGQTLTYFFIQGLGNVQDRNIEITLKEKASVTLYGICIGSGKELHTDINVTHRGKRSTSKVIMKGVYQNSCHGLLNGTIHIMRSAQLSDARLEERVLLLSDAASVNTEPNLEIKADDVKASHAATIAKVSEEELFYLQSRGLTKSHATAMIVNGFLASQLKNLPDKTINSGLKDSIESAMSLRTDQFPMKR